MEAIKTFEQLVYNLNMGPGYDGYVGLVSAIELPKEELDKYCNWSTRRYQRVCFYDTAGLQGILSCWEPGQKGPIHDYNLQQGWLKVLQGELMLELFNPEHNGKAFSTQIIEEGGINYLNDGIGFHRFANRSRQRTIAIHFYSDKIDHWTEYDERTGELSRKEALCDFNLEV